MRRFLDSLRLDLRFALRTFARKPLFTLAAALTLGLGIGAATAVYSIVDAVSGLGAGVVGAVAFRKALGSLLYGVEASDAVTLSAVAAVLLGVAAFAMLAPAPRAARVDPMSALREE